jgi:hypothetical protein
MPDKSLVILGTAVLTMVPSIAAKTVTSSSAVMIRFLIFLSPCNCGHTMVFLIEDKSGFNIRIPF